MKNNINHDLIFIFINQISHLRPTCGTNVVSPLGRRFSHTSRQIYSSLSFYFHVSYLVLLHQSVRKLYEARGRAQLHTRSCSPFFSGNFSGLPPPFTRWRAEAADFSLDQCCAWGLGGSARAKVSDMGQSKLNMVSQSSFSYVIYIIWNFFLD
jgi:hypothetical protein